MAEGQSSGGAGFILMSKRSDLPVELFLFTANLFVDRQQRRDHGLQEMSLRDRFPDLSPEP